MQFKLNSCLHIMKEIENKKPSFR